MSAFDTYTNTVSTSFTNDHGTIELYPSDTPQYARGYQRSDSRRYFEVYIDDAGGDASRLLVGLDIPPGWTNQAIVWGGANVQATFASGAVAPVYPYNPSLGTITVATGDLLMFHVDIGTNATGVNQAGTPVGGTISSGTGELLTPVVVSIGKNGTWLSNAHIGWGWPAHGYPTRGRPLVVRDSTSAAVAKVSLRVETLSFVYAIPSGAIAWGDGPEGGGSSVTDTSIYWDQVKISSYISLSGSNQYAVIGVSVTFTTTLNRHWIYSTQLRSSGKRVIETFNDGPHAVPIVGLCLADSDVTITSCVDSSTKKIGRDYNNVYHQRGVSHQTSITQSSEGYNFYYETPGQILFIDFDAGRYWQTGGLITGGGVRQEHWSGEKDAAVISDPFAGTGGHTFTSSVGGMRLGVEITRTHSLCNTSIFLNVGQRAFETFPLLPPYESMDSGRHVYGIGAKWDSGAAPASVSFQASDLLFRSGAVCAIQGSNPHSSGKKYFEIFRQAQATANDWVGIRHHGATTVSATNNAVVLDSGLWFKAWTKTKNRYGTTLSWTNSSSSSQGGDIQAWFGVAVDFNNGHIWCGCWNRNERKMNWVSGADPVTGTQPDLTFTASTTMNICVITGDTNNSVALVGEDANVIGKPDGFETWNGTTISASSTSTPSGTIFDDPVAGILWPYGVQT